MANKTEETMVTINKAQYAEILGYLKIIENASNHMHNATKMLVKHLPAIRGVPPPRMRRASESIRTMPLKSSLITRKCSQKVSKHKDRPPKTLRFMLPVRPVIPQPSGGQKKASSKADGKTDNKSNAKGSDKSGDKKRSPDSKH